MAGTNFFDYLNAKQSAQSWQDQNPSGSSNVSDSIDNTDAITSPFATKAAAKKKGGFGRRLKKLGDIGIKGIKVSDERIKQTAIDYANYLQGQVSRGEKSRQEAGDIFANFGIAYGIPDTFKIAEQLSSMSQGIAPSSDVEKFRPYQTFAAKQLGIGLTEEDIKGTEAAAQALGYTTPELFSKFLGAKMLTSSEYIRKNPQAFTANLPFGGEYGVPYQSGGTFTGTYRFKPPSTAGYS